MKPTEEWDLVLSYLGLPSLPQDAVMPHMPRRSLPVPGSVLVFPASLLVLLILWALSPFLYHDPFQFAQFNGDLGPVIVKGIGLLVAAFGALITFASRKRHWRMSLTSPQCSYSDELMTWKEIRKAVNQQTKETSVKSSTLGKEDVKK